MTLPLELGAIQDPNIRRAFEQVAQQFPLHSQNLANDVLVLASTGTARKVAFGTSTVTFTASTVSATTNVTHGLGVAPISVQLTSEALGIGLVVSAKGSTTFTAQGWTPTATSGTITFDWVAIG